MRSLVIVSMVLCIAGCGPIETDEVMAPREPLGASGGGEGEVSFRATVQPILVEYCSGCHDESSATGGLDVTSFDAIGAAGVIEPGDPDGSLMVQYLEAGIMPPVGYPDPSDEEIAAIRAWVLAGALDN